MIGRLSGKLLAKHPPQVLLDVGGVAYELDVPMSTFYSLPASGSFVGTIVGNSAGMNSAENANINISN